MSCSVLLCVLACELDSNNLQSTSVVNYDTYCSGSVEITLSSTDRNPSAKTTAFQAKSVTVSFNVERCVPADLQPFEGQQSKTIQFIMNLYSTLCPLDCMMDSFMA